MGKGQEVKGSFREVADDGERELCALVCAPSNKALMVVLEEYLSSIQDHKLSTHKCVLIGVEEKLDNVGT